MNPEYTPLVIPMKVTMTEEAVHLNVSTDEVTFGMTTETMIGDYERYDGDYVVTPSGEEQILDTDRKIMRRDVTVEAIPYYETTNESGGYTVIIGG